MKTFKVIYVVEEDGKEIESWTYLIDNCIYFYGAKDDMDEIVNNEKMR